MSVTSTRLETVPILALPFLRVLVKVVNPFCGNV